jgi:hypothetical protein
MKFLLLFSLIALVLMAAALPAEEPKQPSNPFQKMIAGSFDAAKGNF